MVLSIRLGIWGLPRMFIELLQNVEQFSSMDTFLLVLFPQFEVIFVVLQLLLVSLPVGSRRVLWSHFFRVVIERLIHWDFTLGLSGIEHQLLPVVVFELVMSEISLHSILDVEIALFMDLLLLLVNNGCECKIFEQSILILDLGPSISMSAYLRVLLAK